MIPSISPIFGTDKKRGCRMAIKSAQELLELLQQSRLLSPEQLDDVHDSMLLTNDVAKLLDMLVERGILTEWQKAQLLAGRTGFFIGNYVLLGLLGRGGMGSVFLGRHTTMNRRCAVKIVSKQVGKDPDSLDQFLTEARAIASLDHPNIVQAYDVGKENDHFYIVMEYVEGQSLEEIIHLDGVLDCESAVDCIRQAAEGLAHAHSRNMVHCDIKPSNLLVNEQGIVKILDMGMARLVGESGINSDSRNNQKILGTVDYMAPEQAVSAPTFDYRADIYSLGCTLFAILVGHPPFNEGNLTQRILKHQTQTPPSLRKFRADVPVDLANICLKMMAKNPDDRYHSAREVAEVLSKWTMPAEPITPAKIDNEPFPIPGADSFGDSGIGRSEAVAGPTIETRRTAKRGFWEDERVLYPLLTTIFVVVFGLLIFVVIFFAKSSAPTDQPNRPNQPPVMIGPVEPSSTPDENPPTEGVAPSEENSENTPPEETDDPSDASTSESETSEQTGETPLSHPVVTPSEVLPNTVPSTIPPQPVNSLAELPTAINLPRRLVEEPASSTDSLPLGFLLLGKDPGNADSIELQLIGGEAVLPQDQKFSIVKASSERLPRWNVQLISSNTQTTIAEIWIEKDDNLMFRWLNTDADLLASNLGACVLQVSDGKNVHQIQLLTPRLPKPWKMIPLQDTIVYDVTPTIMTEATPLRLEMLHYSGPYQKVTYKPSAVIKANERTIATLTGEGLPTLTILFEFEVKGRTAQLKASCSYEPQEIRGRRQIRISLTSAALFGKMLLDLEEQRRKLELLLMRNQDNAGQKARHDKVAKELQELMKLGEILSELNSSTNPADISEEYQGLGTFQFREYLQTGTQKIELLKTDGSP